jgi:hypothetical protein
LASSSLTDWDAGSGIAGYCECDILDATDISAFLARVNLLESEYLSLSFAKTPAD